MEWISRRTQLVLVVSSYAAVLALAAVLIVARYFQYVNHPADVAAAGGMYAGGDLILEVFLGGMLLVVTFFLMLVIYKSERAYTIYSKILVGLSLTAPLSFGLLYIPSVNEGSTVLGNVCMFRLFASPMVIAGMGMSRIFARFERAKRLTVWGLLIETLTLIVGVSIAILAAHSSRG